MIKDLPSSKPKVYAIAIASNKAQAIKIMMQPFKQSSA
jgi:hypothetical protein